MHYHVDMVTCNAITIDGDMIPLRSDPQPLSISRTLLGEFQEKTFIMTPMSQMIRITLN